jgi:hypothetical protein
MKDARGHGSSGRYQYHNTLHAVYLRQEANKRALTPDEVQRVRAVGARALASVLDRRKEITRTGQHTTGIHVAVFGKRL